MDLLILANAADDVSAMETVPEVSSPEEVYDIVSGDSLDFDSWTSLISEIEKTYSDNIKAISSVYESFLSWFPLCHEYWKKYADQMARICTVEKAVEIYEQAVQSATYSVGLWVDYCSFSILTFDDPSDIRRIFERGLSYVGKDFLCHKLWDLYIRFELSQQQWSLLAYILIRALKFPTKSLHKYYDNFREFAAFVEEDMSCAKRSNLEPYADDLNSDLFTKSDDEICHAIKELQDSSSVDLRSKALYKLISISERFYKKSCKLHEEIDYFENYMGRDFFNLKPLDDEELQNWHNYLDFIEKHDDFDWAVKLYERCLIPCANYPEFWMRYVEFMESKGGRELANFALERATQVFLKNVSEVHIFNARFREEIGDIEGARAAFHLCDTESDSSFIETAIKKANMETRLGNMDRALKIYDKALKMAVKKEKIHIVPILYIHFFRLKFMITGSADDAIDLLLAGIQQAPNSRLLLEELINFAMMHEGSKHVDIVDPVIASVVTCGSNGSQGLSSKDREDLSLLYLKFVDYCGTTHDIRKAWNRHIKYFPHLIRSTSLQKYPSNRLSNGLKEPGKKTARIIAKQSSRVHNIKHVSPISASKNRKRLTSKSQPIDPDKATDKQYKEKDNENSIKKNTRFQQSEDNPSRNNASKDDQIIDLEKEPEQEVDTCQKPVSLETIPTVTNVDASTDNQNPIPATDSAKKQTETDEHEPETGPQQNPSQNAETCKTNHILTPSVHPNAPNVQQNNTSSAPNLQLLQLLPQPVQSTGQYPAQSSEQSGPVQNPQQMYNQMLQYQYQYQYQQQQNQQQWLQMQQSYQQQQQFQPQQYQMYQQQEQYQQYWLQMYQQQQQQHIMQLQQYQQQSQKQLPQESQSSQMWSSSHNQQGQGTMPPTNIVSASNHHKSSKSLRSPSFERARET